MVERHAFRDGAYWKSYDFAGNVGTQNIFTHPLDFTHDGGEVIFNLPNGLQGYYLVDGSGLRLNEAPINIVSNPAASDPTVRNGISCLGCHTEGMKTFEDQVRPVIESNINPTYDKAQALRLYVEKSEMDVLLQEDMERYKVALDATGGEFDDIEPISRFHEAFQGDVDATYAAAVVGLETEAFLEKIRENVELQNAGLLVLESGSVKRDAWTSSFRDIVFALNFPTALVVPPVVTPPEQKPDAAVRIPDPNLRAAIVEALGKSPNASITVAEMETLREFEARHNGINDLTGLQFATNLSRLNLGEGWEEGKGNQISDLSPIAGLINLRDLGFDRNPVSDLSPLAGLINLERLEFNFANVSDLSPLAGLINLESLWFVGNNVSDWSPLAGLINLKKIVNWASNPISDLSPLAGLTKLEVIDLAGAEISNLMPLVGLTGLKALYLVGNRISDISPLAGLTGLNRLDLKRNNISDVSPLAGLTNLEWLNIANNTISDFSPLDGLSENITLVRDGNPGFPKGGPKIEGPWLWVVLPDTGPSSSKDLLSEASGGMVTEVEIATHGAIGGQSVGDDVWTLRKLPAAGRDNVEQMLGGRIDDAIIYGTVSLYSPREQNTTMYVGSDHEFKVWLNGTLIYEYLFYHGGEEGYQDFFPVTLKQGRNVLLVTVRAQQDCLFWI